jgi:hypothetical protein
MAKLQSRGAEIQREIKKRNLDARQRQPLIRSSSIEGQIAAERVS